MPNIEDDTKEVIFKMFIPALNYFGSIFLISLIFDIILKLFKVTDINFNNIYETICQVNIINTSDLSDNLYVF